MSIEETTPGSQAGVETDPASSRGGDQPVRPPSAALLPLITLGVEHVFDTLTREPFFTPTILAIAADGMRGMWELEDLVPEDAAVALAAIEPRPVQAVAVFDGEYETPDGPRPGVALDVFEAGVLTSTRMLFPYLPGVPGTDMAARVEGEPILLSNGPNPLLSRA